MAHLRPHLSDYGHGGAFGQGEEAAQSFDDRILDFLHRHLRILYYSSGDEAELRAAVGVCPILRLNDIEWGTAVF